MAVAENCISRSPSGERGLKCNEASPEYQRRMSLPIRGAWIEICYVVRGHIGIASRSPSGERGLKSVECCRISHWRQSLPIRGAWIEIALICGVSKRNRRRSPSGERGLKLRRVALRGDGVGRSPSGERGLKYVLGHRRRVEAGSLPIRGAWIEIKTCNARSGQTCSRSPSGERGLKWHGRRKHRSKRWSLPIRGAWIEIRKSANCVLSHKVAPHPGSVD